MGQWNNRILTLCYDPAVDPDTCMVELVVDGRPFLEVPSYVNDFPPLTDFLPAPPASN
ncbi:MAG: hypothetical protein PHI98_14975 [Eubacteriales bacterium]|nr:hypothetical protein [Eubacteriales bacterium]